jgi:prefoldin subunit 5
VLADNLLMTSLLAYKGIIAILLIGVVGASSVASYYYQQSNVKVNQSADLNNQANQLQGQIAALNSQITSLDKQIDSLNSQISQLETLNAQLGNNNSQLISQVNQLNSQVSQLQSQVYQLQTQVASLTSMLKLQTSKVIASEVTIWGSGSPLESTQALINLGPINYSGYLRVSWTGAHASFTAQVFDVNITTPTATSGIFSIPVSANATGNSWFTNYDCVSIPAGILCSSLTYSITYWY